MLVFSRDVELAALESGETHDGFSLTWSNEICDIEGATQASDFGPSGQGNDPQACVRGCAANDDCLYVSVTATGWCRYVFHSAACPCPRPRCTHTHTSSWIPICRYWTTCDTRAARLGSWVYTKTLDGPLVVAENFTLLSTQEVCTTPAFWPGPSGDGYTLFPCLAGCRTISDCKFVSLDKSGVCK
jgi:hypothetical protein